jgi:hypothetical protein
MLSEHEVELLRHPIPHTPFIAIGIGVAAVLAAIALTLYAVFGASRLAPSLDFKPSQLVPQGSNNGTTTGTCPITSSEVCGLVGITGSECNSSSPSWITDECTVPCDRIMPALVAAGQAGLPKTHPLTRAPNSSDRTRSPDPGHNDACALSSDYTLHSALVMHGDEPIEERTKKRDFFRSIAACIADAYSCG